MDQRFVSVYPLPGKLSVNYVDFESLECTEEEQMKDSHPFITEATQITEY